MTDKVIPFPVAKRLTPEEIALKLEWVQEKRYFSKSEVKKLVLLALQTMNEVDQYSDMDAELDLPVKSPSYGWVDQFLGIFEEKLTLEKVCDV